MARRTEMILLTAEDIERFEHHAPAAIARRGGNFMAREVARGCEQIVFGLWPLLGLWLFQWSASETVLLFLVRMWAAIHCDLLKLCCLRSAIREFAKLRYDDRHVWVVAQALREKQKKLVRSHLRAA